MTLLQGKYNALWLNTTTTINSLLKSLIDIYVE